MGKIHGKYGKIMENPLFRLGHGFNSYVNVYQRVSTWSTPSCLKLERSLRRGTSPTTLELGLSQLIPFGVSCSPLGVLVSWRRKLDPAGFEKLWNYGEPSPDDLDREGCISWLFFVYSSIMFKLNCQEMSCFTSQNSHRDQSIEGRTAKLFNVGKTISWTIPQSSPFL